MPQDTPHAGAIAWTAADYDLVRYLWDQARNAAMYDRYFGIEADKVARLNRTGEIIVAVTAPGSVISGFAVWNFTLPSFPLFGWTVPGIALGHVLWIGLGVVASGIAILKPILRPDLIIAAKTKLYSEYRALERAYAALVRSIQRLGTSDDDVDERYRQLEDRMAAADQLRPPKLDEALRQQCIAYVTNEMPPGNLWAPKVPGVHPRVPAP